MTSPREPRPAALAAKAATSTIPIVFGVGEDPVKLGIRCEPCPAGQQHDRVIFSSAEVAAKRLGVLRELVPGVGLWGFSSIRPTRRLPRR